MRTDTEVVTCPNCRIRVLPRQDGTCPSCQATISLDLEARSSNTARSHTGLSTQHVHGHFDEEENPGFVLAYLQRFFGLPKPIYNELSAYLIALTCVLLIATHSDFRHDLFHSLDNAMSESKLEYPLIILLAGWGLLFSIIHVFINQEKSPIEKLLMAGFAVGVSTLATIIASFEAFESENSLILLIIPFWNFSMALVTFIQVRYLKMLDFTDENASIQEVVMASIILLIVYTLSCIIFHLSWAMTFSICIFYSSSILFGVTWLANRFTRWPPNTGSS